MICRRCYCQITELWEYGRVVYVVDNGQTTTADGLTYCPPNPDYLGTFRDHKPRKEISHKPRKEISHVRSV